jgi:hypothetical protein
MSEEEEALVEDSVDAAVALLVLAVLVADEVDLEEAAVVTWEAAVVVTWEAVVVVTWEVVVVVWAAEGVVVDPMVLQVNTGPDNNTNTNARECQRVVRHAVFPYGHKRSLKLLVLVGNGRYNWLQDEASMTLRAVGHGNRYTERLLACFQRKQQVSECNVAMRTSFSRSRPSFARIEYAP